MSNKFGVMRGGTIVTIPLGREAIDEGTRRLVHDIFEKHFPEQEEAPVEWSEDGAVVQEWVSVPHNVRAIQYRQSNVGAVMEFLHSNNIEFFSCNHGELWYLQPDRQAQMDFGDWVVIRDYEDGTSKPFLLDDKDFNQEYGLKKNLNVVVTETEYEDDAYGYEDED